MSQNSSVPIDQLYPFRDVTWYNSKGTFGNVTAVKDVSVLTGHNGHSATMLKITLEIDSSTDLKLVAKVLRQSAEVLNLASEIPTYKDIVQPLIEDNSVHSTKYYAPYLYHGEVNPETQGKLLILSDVNENAVNCVPFFGANHPHNIGKDLTPVLSQYPDVDAVSLTQVAFTQVAKLHAKYWNNEKNNIPSHTNGYKWFVEGVGSEEYDAFIAYTQDSWVRGLPMRPNCNISPYMKEIIDAALNKSNWKTLCTTYGITNREEGQDNDATIGTGRKIPFTIIHCDFYPGNCILSTQSLPNEPLSADVDGSVPKNPNLYIFDYEVTSISHCVQDIIQWCISHLDLNVHKDSLPLLFRNYYDSLEKNYNIYHNDSENSTESPKKCFQSEVYPFADFESDLTLGISKWLWLLCICAPLSEALNDGLYQWFIDQTEIMLQMYNVTVDTVPPMKR